MTVNISLAYMEDLFRRADIEGYIRIHGAPDDEYNSEAKVIFQAITKLPQSQMNEKVIISAIALVWEKSFELDSSDIKKRFSQFQGAAQEILQKMYNP